jgi:hypothetical protein
MPIAFDTLRVGKKYRLTNYGESMEFIIISRLNGNNFLLKDIHTLETYPILDLIKYGRGSDYDLEPLEN